MNKHTTTVDFPYLRTYSQLHTWGRYKLRVEHCCVA